MSPVLPDRRRHILALIVGDGRQPVDTNRLCLVGAELTATDGAAIMLSHDGTSRGSLATSGALSELIEDLQFTFGEGPCIDAGRDGRPVLEPDLAVQTGRWIAFGPPAVAAGVRAVFAFPIRIGGSDLGALSLHRTTSGPLTDEQHADALVLADMAAETILMLQADAPPGELAAALESGSRFHYVVHQASGMVSVQLGVTVEHALVRLRAYAFRTSIPLTDVAKRVVDRSLRFAPDDETGSTA